MKMKVLIVDDEKHCRNIIFDHLKSFYAENAEIEEATNVENAVSVFNEFGPEIIFLDVQMNDGTGFDFLNQINYQSSQIIFTTAFDNYAIKAFDFNAIHYLLKPVSRDDFENAVSRLDNNSAFIDQNKLEHFKTIEVLSNRGLEKVYLEDIQLLESNGSYTKLKLQNTTEHLTSKNLGFYEKNLPNFFQRIHKSYIINMKNINRVMSSEYKVCLKSGEFLPISRRKRSSFLKAWRTFEK